MTALPNTLPLPKPLEASTATSHLLYRSILSSVGFTAIDVTLSELAEFGWGASASMTALIGSTTLGLVSGLKVIFTLPKAISYIKNAICTREMIAFFKTAKSIASLVCHTCFFVFAVQIGHAAMTLAPLCSMALPLVALSAFTVKTLLSTASVIKDIKTTRKKSTECNLAYDSAFKALQIKNYIKLAKNISFIALSVFAIIGIATSIGCAPYVYVSLGALSLILAIATHVATKKMQTKALDSIKNLIKD